MSNCAWCGKYGSFSSLDYGKRYKEQFCSRKCLTEFQQNNYTLHLDDGKIELQTPPKIISDYILWHRKVQKILMKFAILVMIVISTLWGILTLFQTKCNSSDAPKKYAISIIFISIGIFYFYKKIKSKKTST